MGFALPVGARTYTPRANTLRKPPALTRSAYYLPLMGLSTTTNSATVRLKVPMSNLLTADAMRTLMDAQAARWAA